MGSWEATLLHVQGGLHLRCVRLVLLLCGKRAGVEDS